MIGPGKYDDLLTVAREKSGAIGGILLLFHGKRGSGFSCQLPIELTNDVPAMLRTIADQIEQDLPMKKG